MLKTLKSRIRGLPHLLSHPDQLRRLIIRETLYKKRYRNKQQWIEWQKYGCSRHIYMMQAHPDLMHKSSLNKDRIQIFSDIVSRLGNRLRVLDVGCGEGAIGKPLAKMGNFVVSLELPAIATIARKCGVPALVGGDAEHLGFASNSFDVVIASEVLEHLWNPLGFLDEVYRILDTEGYLIIEVPEGREGLRWDSHIQYFTLEALKQMPGARFNVCEVVRLKPVKGVPTPTIILLLHKPI